MSLREEVTKLDCIGGSGEDIADYFGRPLEKLEDLDVLKFCKANKSFKEPGISWDELYALYEAIKVFGNRPIVTFETGMCFGTTTRFFALRNKKFGRKHYSCEIKIREPFKEAMIKLGLWEYVTVLGDSMLTPFDDKIDFLYIDSEHGVVDALGEYMRFRRYLKDEAVVGFHDTDSCWGVREAIGIIMGFDKIKLVTKSASTGSAGIEFYRVVGLNLRQHERHAEMEELRLRRLKEMAIS